MKLAALVGLFGALGSMARLALSTGFQRLAGPAFPVGTLAVNVLGSGALGVVMASFAARGALDTPLRMGITAGFLGGFTTYSAFAYETWQLLEKRSFGAAAANIALTLGACMAACAGGAILGRALAR